MEEWLLIDELPLQIKMMVFRYVELPGGTLVSLSDKVE